MRMALDQFIEGCGVSECKNGASESKSDDEDV